MTGITTDLSVPPSSTPSSPGLSPGALKIFLGVVVPVLTTITGLTLFACWKCRRRHGHFFRGITPIGEDEIAAWKTGPGAKGSTATAVADGGTQLSTPQVAFNKYCSSSALGGMKPSSVIVYSNPYGQGARQSGEGSPLSVTNSINSCIYARPSLDKDLPWTPIHARAPNARAGLTDETVPGDEPFVPGPKRHPSRLYKPPASKHLRTRSSRSSTLSFGECGHGNSHRRTGSDIGGSPRGSQDYINSWAGPYQHKRKISASSLATRSRGMSLGEAEELAMSPLSRRPLFRNGDTHKVIG